MNPGRGRAGILLLSCLVAGPAVADEVVYHRQVSIDVDGVSREEVEGSPREVDPEDEVAEVSFWLRDAPRLSVPLELEVDSADPVAALDRIEARVLAVEAHLDAVEAHQADILAAARSLGATVLATAGLSDSFTVRADAATVAALVARDEVARAQFEVEPTPESNDGRVTRKAMQLEQYESAAPGKQRLREDDANGGIWSFRLDGWCVPEEDAVADPENPYANCQGDGTRTVYMAMYWEDMDRESGELDPEIQ